MLGYQDKSVSNAQPLQPDETLKPRRAVRRPADTDANPAGLFDSVFHEVDEAIAIAGRDPATNTLIIIDVNRQFENKTGHLGAMICGKNLALVFPGIDEVLSGQKAQATSPNICEIESLHADGTSFPAELTIKLFSSPTSTGELVCILRSSRRAPQTSDDDMATRFLSSMSHDLRTPLNGIIGFSEIMMTEMLGPMGKECYRTYAQDIHGAGRDLLRVIDGLLDVTSAISGQSLPQRRERFSLKACITAAVAETRSKALERNVNINVKKARDLPDMAGDYGRILAAFTFIFANAINRSPRGGSVSIAVKKADANRAEIICRDTGPRLSTCELSHIFEPFRVSSDVYLANPVDFGVGFSLVKLTVEQHAGAVIAKNGLRHGIELAIRLPLMTASDT